MTSDAEQKHLQTLHNVQLGIRYHTRRQAFFEACHRFTGIVSLLAGSSAVVSITGDYTRAGAALAAVVAIAQAIDLMVDTRKFANLHNELRRRYLALEPELIHLQALDQDAHRDFRARIAAIEADEPPLNCALMDVVTNEQLHVAGYRPGDAGVTFAQIGWFRRVFSQFL